MDTDLADFRPPTKASARFSRAFVSFRAAIRYDTNSAKPGASGMLDVG
jgi:hypothetical protein